MYNFCIVMNKNRTFNNIIILFIIIIEITLLNSCENQSSPIRQGFLKGLVFDSSTLKPVEGAFICEQILDDSLVFTADSIQVSNRGISYKQWTNTASIQDSDKVAIGSFFMFWTSNSAPTYSKLFAYKSGYHIWRFNSAKDHIIHLSENVGMYEDSLVIRMVKK